MVCQTTTMGVLNLMTWLTGSGNITILEFKTSPWLPVKHGPGAIIALENRSWLGYWFDSFIENTSNNYILMLFNCTGRLYTLIVTIHFQRIEEPL